MKTYLVVETIKDTLYFPLDGDPNTDIFLQQIRLELDNARTNFVTFIMNDKEELVNKNHIIRVYLQEKDEK